IFRKKSDETLLNYKLAFLNSKVAFYLLSYLSPTLNFQVRDIKSLPLVFQDEDKVISISKQLISTSIDDWNSFETSWDFKRHPLLTYKKNDNKVENSFEKWKEACYKRFNNHKDNEESLNEIFINSYELNSKLSPEIDDNQVSIYISDRETDTVSFLSYFIGCVVGRYSLDIDGLAYAGGDFDASKYKTFKPNQDGLILLTDDHYFENDIIVRLREFLSVAFSPDTVDENMRWLAESLKMRKNESPEERLRRYFLDEFFKDHCKTYQKRPIYWLVDSGKQKGLRTLIYMHRYQPDTVATIRFDHLQEIQAKYQNEIEMIDTRLANPSLSATDRRNLEKAIISYQKKIEELQEFDKHLAVYANEQMEIDLDDGVKVNYAKFDKVLAK